MQRLLDAFALHHAGRLDFDQLALVGDNRAFAVDGFTQSVDNAAQQCFADGNIGDATGRFDLCALFDVVLIARDNNADVVFFQVQRDAHRGQAG